MHALIINGSPRVKKYSNTDKILEKITSGMKASGATFEQYEVSDRAQWEKIRERFFLSDHILIALPLFVENIPEKEIIIPLNSYLFEWVIENVCKNAIDAMNGVGTFSIILSEDEKQVFIDLCDTGKGIPNSMHKKIFQPGFTTKQRGWGLGLSLAKRIISEYHKGKIFVKYSVVGQGTDIRVVLPKK